VTAEPGGSPRDRRWLTCNIGFRQHNVKTFQVVKVTSDNRKLKGENAAS
jgi:hypothetical protein